MSFRSRSLRASVLLAILAAPDTVHGQTSGITVHELSASSGYPLVAGRPVAWTAAVDTDEPLEYRFYLYKRTHWVMVRDYDTNRKFTWVPDDADQGHPYYLQVWVRAVGSTTQYDAWRSSPPFAITVPSIDLVASVDFPTPQGNRVTWRARVPTSISYEYKFWMFDQTSATWSVLRDYDPDSNADWTAGADGTYAAEVWARRIGNTDDYELRATSDLFQVAPTELGLTGVFADTAWPARTGTPVAWTARPQGGTRGPLWYQFGVYTTAGDRVLVQPYGPDQTFTWTPTWNNEGEYFLTTNVIDYDAFPWTGSYFWYGPTKVCCVVTRFTVRRAPLQLTTSTHFPVAPGSQIVWKADLQDPTAKLEYQFWVYSATTATWTLGRHYSDDPAFVWTPSSNGGYAIQLWARQVGSTAPYELYRATGLFEIAEGPVRVNSLSADAAFPAAAGSPLTWTAVATGGTAPLEYQFWRRDSAGWVLAQDYGPSNVNTWTPSVAGEYSLQVWVRSSGTMVAYEAFKDSRVFTIQP
jgi:N-acetylmuramoyl-L-alanine amidase